ncbi:ABC transporter ATP-binding protein [Deinococcus detaillensis]|uniref:ABC transporter ATP-binding protein n=1 Tax=Deinococcus detaillensis TaxID=2592048 RepID=UPI001CDD5B5E|nr:ABC transporter ATP-binding protein [Deinococcus detaillensis]
MSQAAARQPVIQLSGITKVYGGEGDAEVHALSGIDLDIFEGEYVALMGPSGSGKSTLMHILGCLDQPTQGSYRLGGDDVSQMGEDELAQIRNERIGFVFQAFNLLARTSAQKNVELPLAYRGVGMRERSQRAKLALTRVGLGDRLGHKPSELSGGQKQRVAIARALVQDPKVLLADEPTGNLDSKSTKGILRLFDELHAEGRTIVLVTHEEEVGARAQRIIWLRDGLISDGRPVLDDDLDENILDDQPGVPEASA